MSGNFGYSSHRLATYPWSASWRGKPLPTSAASGAFAVASTSKSSLGISAAVAMEAGLTPQEAIAEGLPKPEDCDLAVVILWSRIGTPLPEDFDSKADGSPYLSGSEWEYLNSLEGFRKNGNPAVWVYRRDGAPQFAIDDPELTSKRDQWQKLEGFFAAFTNPDGTLAGGFNHYKSGRR